MVISVLLWFLVRQKLIPASGYLDRVIWCCLCETAWFRTSTRLYSYVKSNKILFPGCTNTPQTLLMSGNRHRINCPKDEVWSVKWSPLQNYTRLPTVAAAALCKESQSWLVSQVSLLFNMDSLQSQIFLTSEKDILSVTIIFFYFFYNWGELSVIGSICSCFGAWDSVVFCISWKTLSFFNSH